MSRVLPYENIVSILGKFVGQCNIMTRGKNAVHGIRDLTDIMAPASSHRASIGSCAAAKRTHSGNSNLPGDEWVRKALARADTKDVNAAFDHVTSAQLESLKEITGSGKITIAIDKHLIPRYDKKPGPELLRSKYKKGTSKFEAYITAQCVSAGLRMTLAAFSIGPGHSTADFVRKLVDKCNNHKIRIRCILMDREFFSASVLDTLDKSKQQYIVPCRNTFNVVAALDEFDAKSRDPTSDCTLENTETSVKCIMMIRKRTSCKKDTDAAPREKFIGFATNSSEIDIAMYKKRWGIETGYRMIQDVRMKTRSTGPGARLFCFLASVILYNQWVVINAQWGFVSSAKKWQGITFTMPEFKCAMESRIVPEPPPVPP